jgi:hypothetical protein
VRPLYGKARSPTFTHLDQRHLSERGTPSTLMVYLVQVCKPFALLAQDDTLWRPLGNPDWQPSLTYVRDGPAMVFRQRPDVVF